MLALMFIFFSFPLQETTESILKFRERIAPFESLVDSSNTNPEFSKSLVDFESKLDSEMELVVNLAQKYLEGELLIKFNETQKLWENFKKAEFDLIDLKYDRDNYGRESFIHKAMIRIRLMKNRIESNYKYIE